MMSQEPELLKLLLPEYLVEYFEIIEFKEEEGLLHLYFEEKNTVPKEFWDQYQNLMTRQKFGII